MTVLDVPAPGRRTQKPVPPRLSAETTNSTNGHHRGLRREVPRDSDRSRLDAPTSVPLVTRRPMAGFEVSIEGVDAPGRLERVTVTRGYRR
jgi:hypothetical protein